MVQNLKIFMVLIVIAMMSFSCGKDEQMTLIDTQKRKEIIWKK